MKVKENTSYKEITPHKHKETLKTLVLHNVGSTFREHSQSILKWGNSNLLNKSE